jgi:hypothetical protein
LEFEGIFEGSDGFFDSPADEPLVLPAAALSLLAEPAEEDLRA